MATVDFEPQPFFVRNEYIEDSKSGPWTASEVRMSKLKAMHLSAPTVISSTSPMLLDLGVTCCCEDKGKLFMHDN